MNKITMLNTKKVLIRSIFPLLLSTLTCNAANIIFDLSGVLFKLRKFGLACDIGIRNCLSAGSGKNARMALLDYLNAIEPRDPQTPLARDENGTLLPQLMCDWLTGKKTPLEIRTLINKNMQLCPLKYQKFIPALADVIFTPESFYKHQKLIKFGTTLVKSYIDQGHDVYILSNWDPESFALLHQKYNEFFGLFKGIMISGNVGLLKPDPKIYEAFLTTYNLDPKDCIFIDDQECNRTGAQAHGIAPVLCPSKGHLWWRTSDFPFVTEQINAILAKQKNKPASITAQHELHHVPLLPTVPYQHNALMHHLHELSHLPTN